MAFLGGLFGGSKSNTSTSSTTATTVGNTVDVDVAAEISPVINTAIDLTGFSEAIGAVAGVLQTVADKATKPEPEKEKTGLAALSELGGAATAILAMMAVFFALSDPKNVKVQL
jgi:hypothetical protein